MKVLKKIFPQLLFIFFLFLGIFLRFYRLGEVPVSLYWDEAAIGIDAYSLNETGRDMNNMSFWQPVFGSYGDFKAPVLIWLATLSVHFFGLSEWSVRLPVAVFSVFSLLLFYFFLRELLSFDRPLQKRLAYLPLIAFILMAVSAWPVHFARIAFESSLSVFFLLAALFSFLKLLRASKFFAFPMVLAAVLGVYSYYSLRVILPFLFVSLVVIFWSEAKKKLTTLSIAAVLFVLAVLPIVLSPYYARSQDYRLNNHNLITHTDIILESSQYLERYADTWYAKFLYHRYLFMLRDFSSNMFAHYSVDFLFFHGDPNLRQHSGYLGEFPLLLLPFYFLGLYLLAKHWRSPYAQLSLALLLLSPIPAAMVYEVPHASRAIYTFLPLLMLMSWAVAEFLFILKEKSRRFFPFVLGILLFGLLGNTGFFAADYFLDYPERSSEAWLYPYNQMAKYYAQHYQEYSAVTIDGHYWFPEIFFYYAKPDLIISEQRLKNALLNSPVNSFGIPNPTEVAEQKANEEFSQMAVVDPNFQVPTRPKAAFLYYDQSLPTGYVKVMDFPLYDGQPSMILAVEQTENQESK